MNRKISVLVAGVCGLLSAQSAVAESDYVFNLGEILVTAPKDDSLPVATETIGMEEIRLHNRTTVGDALNLLPGVTLSNNLRNEQMVSVRGYDARQVPLFIDGIPVYVPYDGYVDLGRFTTGDLAAIQVAKGYSSVSFGPNTLGGAINLVSRKPTKELEGDARIGFSQENTKEVSANVGTNQGTWYVQAGASYRDSDGFRLSDDFKPTATEDGGRRDNSQSRDQKVSLKFGLTPNETDEYALSYYKQEGEKGQPPSTVPTARFWKWPMWDKESLYFVSKTALGQHETVKLRLYHDKFDNEVDSYTDSSYSVLKKSGSGSVGSGRSIYHDKTHGGSVELESSRIANNTFRLVAQYKNDRHEEVDGLGVLGADFEDSYKTIALEDAVKLGERALLTLGYAHHVLDPQKVYKPGQAYSLPEKQTANDPQAALSYDLNQAVTLYGSVAQKTRLPTLKDRYSQRLGNYVENPGLSAEQAHNYEVGVKALPWGGAQASVAYFVNKIQDKIQTVNLNGAATCSNVNQCQMQNVGEVEIKGIELSLTTPVGESLEIGGNLTRMQIENISDPTVKIVGVPETKMVLNAVWKALPAVKVVGFAEHNGRRWASNTVELGNFTTMNLKGVWEPKPGLTAEVGVNNLTDKNYALDYGFPSPGRMWFTNLSYVF